MTTGNISWLEVRKGNPSGNLRTGRTTGGDWLIVAVLVLVAVVGGAATLTSAFSFSHGGAPAAAYSAATAAPDGPAAAPYFPSQYVNQATTVEPQPPTF